MKNTRARLFADLLNAFSVCKIALSQLCWHCTCILSCSFSCLRLQKNGEL